METSRASVAQLITTSELRPESSHALDQSLEHSDSNNQRQNNLIS